MIDAHAHLTDDSFGSDLPDIVRNARDAGVEAIINPGTDLLTSEGALALAARYPGFIFPAAGIHPHDSASAGDDAVPRLRELLHRPGIVGIGETGLDFYKDHSPRETQVAMFVKHVELACETGLPLIVHVRDSAAETFDILSKHPGISGMIHSFSDGPEEADRFLLLGFFVSFSGILTYPKAEGVRQAAQRVPLDRFLVETDAPYLPPQSRRGRRCEPAHGIETARKFAELRNLSFEVVSRAASENARRLFRIAVPVA